MNNAKIVNIGSCSGAELRRAFMAQLSRLLAHVPWLNDCVTQPPFQKTAGGFDFQMKLSLPGRQERTLCVQCTAQPRPSQFLSSRMSSQAKETPVFCTPVLAAPFISPRMAQVCEAHGWSWFDLAGNYYLSIPGVLHLEHTGLSLIRAPHIAGANLATAQAGRVIRALLVPENAGIRWTHRTLSGASYPRVSIGLVNKLARHLREEGYVEYLPEPDEGFRLRDPMGLLQAWREAYRFDRHERRRYFTLLSPAQLQARLLALNSRTDGGAAYAVFTAADIQAPHVRQGKTWLYVRAPDLSLFEQLIEAKEVDSGENLIVLIPEDEGVFFMAEEPPHGQQRIRCTNPVQTYVDLWHAGVRGVEAGEALLERTLEPAWKRGGLSV